MKRKINKAENSTGALGNSSAKKSKAINHIAQILCVVLAVIIWFYAVNVDSPIFTREIKDIPVEIQNVTGNLSVLSGDGYTVTIRVRGRQSDVNRLQADDFTAYVDAAEMTEAGEQELSVQVKTPNGIALEEILDFKKITVYLDERISVSVPLVIDPSGYSYSSDYELQYMPSDTD